MHVYSWTNKPGPWLHVVRYEDMLGKPSSAFAKVARFLGLSPERERLERAIRLSSFESLRSQEEKKGFRERSRKCPEVFPRRQGRPVAHRPQPGADRSGGREP